MKYCEILAVTVLLHCAGLCFQAKAETGAGAWLRYAALPPPTASHYEPLPGTVIALGDSLVVKTAQRELVRGVKGMLGRTLRTASGAPESAAIVLGSFTELHALAPALSIPSHVQEGGYWLGHARMSDFDCLLVGSPTERGVLYGVFALLSKIARDQDVLLLDELQQPYAPLRWINQWDNLDGTIERGYAGRSIFFEDGKVRADLNRVSEYARLLASLGINGCNVNNVNADARILADDFLPQLARLADTFRPWGVRLSVSVDLSAPKKIGGLDTFDPLNPGVAAWWKQKVENIFKQIPDFGGFVVKADSEGRLGPLSYGRSPADAANVIALALKPQGGVLFYRAFVYDHHLDWRNLKNDRAKAAYDIFHPLDGKFEDNVIIQIKNGPIDFQVREPVSPLLGGLQNTNEAVELQITQEYTGQQRHLCFLAPMWKEVLDFDLRVGGAETPVKDLVSGRTFHRSAAGFVGVANVGMDANWLAHPLAMANLYGFGRLAWDPSLSSSTIIDEWTRLTFGNDPLVVRTISEMQLSSWHTYESYTGPLGVGTLTNIVGNHYDPVPDSSERNGWGQWHRADHDGIGMDRTVAAGTGFIGQYAPAVQKEYESLAACPDELLLFFHHVSYTHKLHAGKTVMQHVYDSHYEGAATAAAYVPKWKLLNGHLDKERYMDVLRRLEYQAAQAVVWRDTISDWFYRMSGIADARGRVGRGKDITAPSR